MTFVKKSGLNRPKIMEIALYAINLDRSVERWERLNTQAATFHFPLIRFPAVDGRLIAKKDRLGTDETGFVHRNGRQMMSGEYGCYRSHVAILDTILASDSDAAIVLEDDVELVPDLLARAGSILDAVPKAELVKLINHRTYGFVRHATSSLGDRIGRCLHGPQGSSACYIVTRAGAAKLRDALATMEYAHDVALERGWHTGVATFTVRHNIVNWNPHTSQSQVVTDGGYGATKVRGLKRLPTHMSRAVDYIRRIVYALTMR